MFQEFTPAQYLKIDVANNYGLDKMLWDERIDWFDANEHQLEKLIPQAKEGPLFFAGVDAWRKVQRGEMNHYPISLDATSSGLQWLSIMTHDEDAAKLCNVIDVGHRMDAYTAIYEMMDIGGAIPRDRVKAAIMTAFYSSVAVPKEVFGEGEMLTHFNNTMQKAAPRAWLMNLAFSSMWDKEATMYSWQLPDLFQVHSKVMDFEKHTVMWDNQPWEVRTRVNKPTESGRSLSANAVHSVDGFVMSEMMRRCMFKPSQVKDAYDLCFTLPRDTYSPILEKDNAMVEALWGKYMETGYLSVRIIQHLNEDNIESVDKEKVLSLLGSLPKKPFQILTVHDCYRCLLSYGNDLRKQYNRIMHDVAQSSILENIIKQMTGKELVLPKDPTFAAKLLEANYALS